VAKKSLPWPLGINEWADEVAHSRGLEHWCATVPTTNLFWIRRDGVTYKPNFKEEIVAQLSKFGSENPMGAYVFGVE
jgi:hypothetical protein